jgi:hypothetical protein
VSVNERAVPGRNLAGKRVRDENMATEDEDEDIIEHKRPAPTKRRSDNQNLDVFR